MGESVPSQGFHPYTPENESVQDFVSIAAFNFAFFPAANEWRASWVSPLKQIGHGFECP
jgi:hypothetical protein